MTYTYKTNRPTNWQPLAAAAVLGLGLLCNALSGLEVEQARAWLEIGNELMAWTLILMSAVLMVGGIIIALALDTIRNLFR
jgi:hypothetical protein